MSLNFLELLNQYYPDQAWAQNLDSKFTQNDQYKLNKLTEFFMQSQPIEISEATKDKIKCGIQAFWKLANSQKYREALPGSEKIHFPSNSSVLMGYDFHLTAEGPKLIEINTNAGGYFISGLLQNIYNQEILKEKSSLNLNQQTLQMFQEEWTKKEELKTIALVDNNIEAQYLLPDFKIWQSMMEAKGYKIIFSEPSQINLADKKIQMIYWRHTDFYLENFPQFKKEYEDDSVCVTPNPAQYFLLADKNNMLVWNSDFFKKVGLSEKDAKSITEILLPSTPLNTETEFSLWEQRKKLIFKPPNLYGSRGVYRGKNISKTKWKEIVSDGTYISQEFCPAPKHKVNENLEVKYDLRAFVYRNQILLLGARGYQGQVTNFRDDNSGFWVNLLSRF